MLALPVDSPASFSSFLSPDDDICLRLWCLRAVLSYSPPVPPAQLGRCCAASFLFGCALPEKREKKGEKAKKVDFGFQFILLFFFMKRDASFPPLFARFASRFSFPRSLPLAIPLFFLSVCVRDARDQFPAKDKWFRRPLISCFFHSNCPTLSFPFNSLLSFSSLPSLPLVTPTSSIPGSVTREKARSVRVFECRRETNVGGSVGGDGVEHFMIQTISNIMSCSFVSFFLVLALMTITTHGTLGRSTDGR